MSVFAHFTGPARRGVAPEDFALVQARYVLMPAVLWTAAMAVVLVITATQVTASRMATQTPAVAEPCECFAYGA